MRVMKFFWSAAVALSLWELLVEPVFTETVMVTCSSAGPLDWPQPVPAAQVAGFLGDWLARVQPVLLALTAIWAIRSRPRGAPNASRGSSLLPAALGLVLALLPAALAEVEERLSPDMPFMWQECLHAQVAPQSFVAPRLILAWLLSPATMVLLAGIAGAGIRPRLTDLREAGLAVAGVVLAAFLPAALIGLPVNADGTPRYAVAGAGRPYVLDLESGEPVSLLPQATRTYVHYDLIVRDTEPGHYVAALTSLSGRYFRLYRLSMSDDGRITVGERLTPSLKGTANGLAVSTEGRIAYGRMTDQASFAGTLEREWPVSGYRLQWLDARSLALPEHSVPAGTLATLDVGTGTIGQVPAPAEHEFTRPILPLPGGRQLRALGWPTRTLVLHEGTRLVRKVLALDCGHIESLALDPTGRYVLVGVDREAAEMDRSPLAGLPPCGGARSQLLRLDLETGHTQVVPGEQDPLVQAW
ncbi:hypothetical protein [Nonomuraea sp. CA-141351]|uniref:hypothetical protein n=1 Tax=Nonomuraea sp. CA-141351 TaxID=3239996 RepID=UPI003D8ACF7C